MEIRTTGTLVILNLAYFLDQSTDLHTTRDPADLGISIRMEIRTLVEQIQAYF